jgi:predicted DNA binding CopG/RHH family protein
MKRKTVKYTDDKGEMDGKLQRIRDDLPSPEELAGEIAKRTKVTLELDNDALAFFKREASRRRTSYQRMIRNLVRSYARAQASR